MYVSKSVIVNKEQFELFINQTVLYNKMLNFNTQKGQHSFIVNRRLEFPAANVYSKFKNITQNN